MGILVIGNCYCSQSYRGQFDNRGITIRRTKWNIREVVINRFSEIKHKRCNVFFDVHEIDHMYTIELSLRALIKIQDPYHQKEEDYVWEYDLPGLAGWRFNPPHIWRRKKLVKPETVLRGVVELFNSVPENWRAILLDSMEGGLR